MVQAELVHGRWAMLGAAGILFTAATGLPQWYEAGKVAAEGSSISFPNLVVTTFLLMGWAEGKRWADLKNPGSQGDGSFFGITDDFKGTENGYPGGRFFDPMGMSRGGAEAFKAAKNKEIKNGRLAMVAMLGFFSQYAATGEGPIQNLQAHLADPSHVTFATNGVSIPWLK
jgi:light-harvesting complex I chlorophyll a/b binding protein 5